MEFTQVQEKRCAGCGETKPLTSFNKDKSRKDGLHIQCRDCRRKYREANHEKHLETFRVWSRKNTEKNRERARAWRLANPERHRANSSAWKRANPDKTAAHTSKRAATKLYANPNWADHQAIAGIYAQAKELSRALGVEIQVDHVVPLQSPLVCGLHCPANLQLLEMSENISKGNRCWPDMP